ncbi:unnamed protein product [Allacma fusca]|uniref:Bromo domain-containing protein n=1 Tax=Allacma fusca TaxID=39272 RepID=A0A8J2JQB7_9HEXA|nr:unnamed protein product [Allacma fusca]
MDDVQSWWEVPCIAHFCSLFRSSFGLLDFDIEELEEALLTHTVEEVGSSLIQDLIVRLLKGCFNSNKDEITSSNYQMYLRRLFRIKCEEDHSRKNPFNKDVAFHSLPLRTKVEILYDLCDFRLDGDEVQEVLKSLESHSLRVTALGKDSGGSTYWYFYGTRLYREDYGTSPTSSPVRKRGKKCGNPESASVPFGSLLDSKWQVVCYTEEDWQLLTRKFKNCKSKHERSLHRTLKEDFLPELPRLFAEKEKLQRKRMMEQQLRRSSRNNTSSASGFKSGSDDQSSNQRSEDMSEDELKRLRLEQEKADRLLAEEIQREERKARIHLRERRGGGSGGVTSSGSNGGSAGTANSPNSQKSSKKGGDGKGNKKRMTNNSMAACLPPVMEIDSSANSADETPQRDSSRSPSPAVPPPPATSKSKTSQAAEGKTPISATTAKKKKYDDLVKESGSDTKGGMSKTKVKSSVIFSQNEEDVIIGMHKVIEAMKNHRDAWPFVNPVDEDYAPNYYRVISQPMDLQAIEDKLDNQEYASLEEFKTDFQKIVDNCRKYNGPTSEYTEMVENLQDAFNKAIQRYIIPDESDEEISIEYSTGNDRKRPRINSVDKKSKISEKTTEHKKENEPHNNVKKTNSKSKSDKHDKKKLKQQLMRHHSRNSEAMDALTSATAETLKDLNKWLGDTPKISEYSSSSPRSVSSESLVLRSEEREDERRNLKPKMKDLKAGTRRKILNPDRDGDKSTSPVPSAERAVTKEKIKAKKSKPKEKSKDKDVVTSGVSKDGKEKHHHHHHHRHHRHHKSHSTISRPEVDRSVSPEMPSFPRKTTKSQDVNKGHNSRSHSPHISKSLHSQSGSQKESDKPEPTPKKAVDTSKSKSVLKRGSSFMMGLKNSGTIKRLQGTKLAKFNTNHQESKIKTGGNNNAASVYDFVATPVYSKSFMSSSDFSGGMGNSTTNNHGGHRDTNEKKKCLLINDSPSGKEGGPRLSLGSVLSTDAIKLGDFKRDDALTDEEDNVLPKSGEKIKNDKFDDLKAKIYSMNKPDDGADDGTKVSDKVDTDSEVKDVNQEGEDTESVEIDRKLEPSKGFNREKCMPNLSAWIKAFGGPQKTTSQNSYSCAGRKAEGDPKSKFKVLGRGSIETNEERSKHSNSKGITQSSSSSVQPKGKTPELGKGQDEKQHSDQKIAGNNVNITDDMLPINVTYDHPPPHLPGASSTSSKRHRNRKMSSSSLSSQSESGSPCFVSSQDDISNRIVINPPRWVDEHWGPQSQSPSASSHVSSQSPAGPNSPFSPPMSSPPHTPQTPPWPPAPVRVGFYQDITSQHSSPEKVIESSSSVASPSTPPSVGGSNGSGPPSNREGKNYSVYAGSSYAPRYSSSIPSPGVGPGSNLPSPSSGINTNVDSPGNGSLSMGSPHSPNVPNNNGTVHASDYSRMNLNNSPSSPNMHHPQPQTTPVGPSSGGQPKSLQVLSPATRASSRSGSVINLNANAPGVVPGTFPAAVSSSGNYMMETSQAHIHGHSPHPENAHVHHHQPPSQGPPRYAHTLPPAHQSPGLSQSPGLPSTTAASSLLNHGLSRSSAQGLPPTLSSSISSSSQPQPSPYPSNPYTSNPRSINVAPSVYSSPIGPETRFYKPIVSAADVSLGVSSTVSGTSTTTSTSKSKKLAAAELENLKSGTASGGSPSPTVVTSAAAAVLESAKLSSELNVNGFQWPHNLASLSQIVNSIPNPMTVGVGVPAIAQAYRSHYDSSVASAVESMGKFPRSEAPPSYTNLTVTGKPSSSGAATTSSSHPEKSSTPSESPTDRRSSSKSESKQGRSQGSSSKSSTQSIVPGSAFNFSALAPDLALYSKEIPDPSSLYTASPPSLAHHHRADLYPTSTANFHTSFAAASAARTTAGGVPTASIPPYQIPPFIGSHPSPYQPQSVSSQPFAHSQSPRGIVDPYQQFFQGSPHVMGLLPPSSYSAPYAHPHHSLGFNRPGWI